jgi:hypothetical protein
LKLIDESRDSHHKKVNSSRLDVNVNGNVNDVSARHEAKENDRVLQKLSQKN